MQVLYIEAEPTGSANAPPQHGSVHSSATDITAFSADLISSPKHRCAPSHDDDNCPHHRSGASRPVARSTFITPTPMSTMGSATLPHSPMTSDAASSTQRGDSDELMLPTAPLTAAPTTGVLSPSAASAQLRRNPRCSSAEAREHAFHMGETQCAGKATFDAGQCPAMASSAPQPRQSADLDTVDDVLNSSPSSSDRLPAVLSPSAMQTYVSAVHSTGSEVPLSTVAGPDTPLGALCCSNVSPAGARFAEVEESQHGVAARCVSGVGTSSSAAAIPSADLWGGFGDDVVATQRDEEQVKVCQFLCVSINGIFCNSAEPQAFKRFGRDQWVWKVEKCAEIPCQS